MDDARAKWVAGVGAIALLGVLMLAVGSKGGSMLDGLGDLVPSFGQEAEAFQQKVMAQTLEVKDMRKKIDDLKSLASRDPKNEASRKLASLIENSIFPSALKSQIDARIELANVAMREKSFKKAQRLLEEPVASLQRAIKTAGTASEMIPLIEELQKLEKTTGSRLSTLAQLAAEGVRSGSLFVAPTGNATVDDAQTQKIADAGRIIQEDLQRLKGVNASQVAAAQAAAADRRRREDEARQRQMEEDRRVAQQKQEERQRQVDASRQRDEQVRGQQLAQQRFAREQQEAQTAAACESARSEAKAAAIVGTMAAFTCGGAANSSACFEKAQAGLNNAQAKMNRFCR